MKTSKRNKLLCLALTGGFGLSCASGVFAEAGDTISNRATLSYDVGTVSQTVIESGSGAGNSTPGVTNGTDTNFLEDRLINFDVARVGSTTFVVPGETLRAVEFSIKNTGNGDQDFLLKGLNNADALADPNGGTADIFDATAVTIQTFVESGATLGFQSAEDTETFVDTLSPADLPKSVYVVATIPTLRSDGLTSLVNNDVAVMTLVAQVANAGGTGDGTGAIMNDANGNASPGGTGFTNGAATLTTAVVPATADDPTLEQVVFNDPAGTRDGTGSLPGLGVPKNGQNADDSSYTVETAALLVTKDSLALWDDFNLDSNPKSIPGGFVRYTISVENTGTVAATLTSIADVLTLTLMDPQFSDGGPTNAALPAAGTNNVRITDGLGAVTFCTANGAAADGCTYAGTLGDAVTVDLSIAAGTATLAAGQTLTVEFNVIVQ